MDQAYANAEKYLHRPWLMDRAVNSLQQEVGQFFDWIDSLLDDFMAISKQRLDEIGRLSRIPGAPGAKTISGRFDRWLCLHEKLFFASCRRFAPGS